MDSLTFGVLGPVEVAAPGRPAATLPPSVRTLLARLAMSPGRVVSVDALTDALWGEDLPGDAANALQIRVSKLRRALGAAGVPADVLVTRAPGYQLAVDGDAVDAQRFERLLSRARACTDAPAALALLDQALALWRGPALADVGDAEWIEAESTRLEELRLGALEDRLDLLLELGRHAEAVADLERLVTLHPLRERLHRLLLVALYRGGRQADALAVYHQLRERLADELGIDPSPELQSLAEAILRQQVPAPREAEAPLPRIHGTAPELPQRLSEVIGRQDDITAVLEGLRHARLVTLTGPGGVGKTTLATEVARTVADAVENPLADDVRLVRLAALEPGADVAEAVARQLGLQPPGPGDAAVTAVLAFLAPLRTLLVVDNCEHVVDSAAELLEQILQACPGVRVLATSREALAVAGEVQVAVHPLAVPADDDEDATAIGDSAAVRLFVERARNVRPGFALDAGSAPLVALICRQLDGVPLAIELAAARTKALPLHEIADRLGDRFALLTSGPRTSEARHRTLRATLDWSYELLSDAERALLRRLAVFRGGWTVEAAEEVCAAADGDGDRLDRGDVLDLLFRLVDRSLVVPDPDAGRFRMLVTIRDYGWARLREAGEVDAVRDLHLRYFTTYAQEHGSLSCWGGVGWARMRAEHDNLRAAVDHAIERARRSREPRDVDAGFRLANAMVWFWQYNVRYEGVAALTALLALPGGSPASRGLALQGLAIFHVYYPTPQSRAAARESLAILEQVGDVRSAAMSKLVIAWEAQYGGDLAQARALTAEAAEVVGEDDSPGMRAQLHYVTGLLDLGEGAFERSIEQWRLALEEFVRAGDVVIGSAVRVHLGLALRETGRVDEALAELRTAVDMVWDGETMHGLAFALVHYAHTLLDVGADGDVRALLDRADDVARRAQNPRCQAWAAWGRARLALADGAAAVAVEECERAVALLQDREFPWALARLEAFLAGARHAAGGGTGVDVRTGR